MPGTSGKEPSITYRDKISFGSNMLIWKNFWGSSKKPEQFSKNGWNGFLGKKHGWLTLNLRREWDSHKKPKMSFINIWKLIRHYQRISKLPNSSSGTEIKKQPENYLSKLLSTWVHKRWMKHISLISANSKSSNISTIGQERL